MILIAHFIPTTNKEQITIQSILTYIGQINYKVLHPINQTLIDFNKFCSSIQDPRFLQIW